MSTSVRKRRCIAGFALVPAAALVLASCVPPTPAAPAPAPAAAPAPASAPAPETAKASATTGTFDRSAKWDASLAEKFERPPFCTEPNMSDALESCHLTYALYNIDTTSGAAQNKAQAIAATITRTQCSTNLASFHSGVGFNPTLGSQYPAMSPLAENLYCFYFNITPAACPSGKFGAERAMAAWIASTLGHKQTLDSYAGRWVNAAAVCNPSTGVYVAVAQFHH